MTAFNGAFSLYLYMPGPSCNFSSFPCCQWQTNGSSGHVVATILVHAPQVYLKKTANFLFSATHPTWILWSDTGLAPESLTCPHSLLHLSHQPPLSPTRRLEWSCHLAGRIFQEWFKEVSSPCLPPHLTHIPQAWGTCFTLSREPIGALQARVDTVDFLPWSVLAALQHFFYCSAFRSHSEWASDVTWPQYINTAKRYLSHLFMLHNIFISFKYGEIGRSM